MEEVFFTKMNKRKASKKVMVEEISIILLNPIFAMLAAERKDA